MTETQRMIGEFLTAALFFYKQHRLGKITANVKTDTAAVAKEVTPNGGKNLNGKIESAANLAKQSAELSKAVAAELIAHRAESRRERDVLLQRLDDNDKANAMILTDTQGIKSEVAEVRVEQVLVKKAAADAIHLEHEVERRVDRYIKHEAAGDLHASNLLKEINSRLAGDEMANRRGEWPSKGPGGGKIIDLSYPQLEKDQAAQARSDEEKAKDQKP